MSESIAIVAAIVAQPAHRSQVEAALKRAAAATLLESGCERVASSLRSISTTTMRTVS